MINHYFEVIYFHFMKFLFLITFLLLFFIKNKIRMSRVTPNFRVGRITPIQHNDFKLASIFITIVLTTPYHFVLLVWYRACHLAKIMKNKMVASLWAEQNVKVNSTLSYKGLRPSCLFFKLIFERKKCTDWANEPC